MDFIDRIIKEIVDYSFIFKANNLETLKKTKSYHDLRALIKEIIEQETEVFVRSVET